MKRRTVFVLGAGASKDFGLPLGFELRDIIISLLERTITQGATLLSGADERFQASALQMGFNWKQLLDASEAIRSGLYYCYSIDDFLSENTSNPAVVELGRLAIAASILQGEANASNHLALEAELPAARRNAVQHLSQTWLGNLFIQLKRGITPAEAGRVFEGASFIVFNYDRCLEQFLFWAVRDAFNLPTSKAKEVVETLPIIHVYGSTGSLPQLFTGGTSVPFGAREVELLDVARQIRTYGEDLVDEGLRKEISALMDEAEQVVFLGYAFHQQGMKLLYPSGPRVGQTALGTWVNLKTHVEDYCIATVRSSDSFFERMQCGPFIDHAGNRIFG